MNPVSIVAGTPLVIAYSMVLQHNVHQRMAYLASLHVLRGGVAGWRVLHQNFCNEVQHAIKNCTQSDVRFCKNKESNRSKINEKESQIGSKIK